MLEQLYLILPMTIIVIGAFTLMLLSQVSSFDLKKSNLVAVLFLTLALAVVVAQFGSVDTSYLFEDIIGKIFIVDDFAILFDIMSIYRIRDSLY